MDIVQLFYEIHGGLSELFVPGRYDGGSSLRKFGITLHVKAQRDSC